MKSLLFIIILLFILASILLSFSVLNTTNSQKTKNLLITHICELKHNNRKPFPLMMIMTFNVTPPFVKGIKKANILKNPSFYGGILTCYYLKSYPMDSELLHLQKILASDTPITTPYMRQYDNNGFFTITAYKSNNYTTRILCKRKARQADPNNRAVCILPHKKK